MEILFYPLYCLLAATFSASKTHVSVCFAFHIHNYFSCLLHHNSSNYQTNQINQMYMYYTNQLDFIPELFYLVKLKKYCLKTLLIMHLTFFLF